MEAYRVQKTRVAATLRLDDGFEQGGHLFVPVEPLDMTTAEKVQQLLNGPESFLPMAIDGGATVVQNKDRVIWCRHDGPAGPVVEVLNPRRRVTLVLADDTALNGDLVADGPPDRRRVLDVLNRSGRFVLVETADGDYLVRRDAITFVPTAELGDGGDAAADAEGFELQVPDELSVV